PAVRALLDLSQPVALLVVSVLHFIADSDDPEGIVGKLGDAVAPGSYLVLSHLTPPGGQKGAAGAPPTSRRSDLFAKPRDRTEVERVFGGFELVEPGLVPVEHWRPDPPRRLDDDRMLLCMQAGGGRERVAGCAA